MKYTVWRFHVQVCSSVACSLNEASIGRRKKKKRFTHEPLEFEEMKIVSVRIE